jgi:hypothetical protein
MHGRYLGRLTRLITATQLLELRRKVVEIRLRLLSPRKRLLLQFRAVALQCVSTLRGQAAVWRVANVL